MKQVKVKTVSSGMVEVKAYSVYGHFAVTRRYNMDPKARGGKHYCVTHVPTGERLGRDDFTLANARKVAKKLHTLSDLTLVGDTDTSRIATHLLPIYKEAMRDVWL